MSWSLSPGLRPTTRRRLRLSASIAVSSALFAVLGAGPLLAQAGPAPDRVSLISGNVDGFSTDGESRRAAISPEGEFVAFESTSTQLHFRDQDELPDIYLRELATGALTLVSLRPPPFPGLPPVKGDGASRYPALSSRGTRVVFASEAGNLVPEDGNGRVSDIFFLDPSRGSLRLVSLSPRGEAGNGPSTRPAVSADGRVIVFQSQATTLGGAPAQQGTDRIHIWSEDGASIVRIDAPAGLADGPSRAPSVSADGRFVVFESDATNLVPGDTNQATDVFLHDRQTGAISLVSGNGLGQPGAGPSSGAHISPDGRHVVFESRAGDLVGGDLNDRADVFVRDLLLGRTERVSVAGAGEELAVASVAGDLSDQGRFVAFTTTAAISPLDDNKVSDVYLRDRLLGRTFLASGRIEPRLDTFLAANGPSQSPALSDSGEEVVYDSASTDIVPGDRVNRLDVYHSRILQVPAGPFPPANFLYLNVNGLLRQFELTGRATGRTASFRERPVRGFAVDEWNALWLVGDDAIARYEALRLGPAAPGQDAFVPGKVPDRPVHSVAASGGFVFIAGGRSLARVALDGETETVDLVDRNDPDPSGAAIALDPFGTLWAGVDLDGVLLLRRFDRALHLLGSTRRSTGAPLRQLACDPRGALYVRTTKSLLRLSRSGAQLWSLPLDQGGGLAVNAAGDVFTMNGKELLGVHGSGRPYLRAEIPDLGDTTRAAVFLDFDGEGALHLATDGGRAAFRLEIIPGQPLKPVQTVEGALALNAGSDGTGFLAANIFARSDDQDDDGVQNGVETANGTNPFDPEDPSRLKRLPPVLDLRATRLPGQRVRLTWRSVVPFAQYFVLRDGVQIQGSPFTSTQALRGEVIDPALPAGTHVYRVLGQGAVGLGGGGGLVDDIPEPFSFSSEATVSLGDGSVLVSTSTPSPPEAVAHDGTNGYAVLGGGILWKLDNDLGLVTETTLPADPFAFAEVRGAAADPATPGVVYLLLGDGRVYRKADGAAPVLQLTLQGHPTFPGPDGLTGLAATSGNGNDLFTTMAGPGVDCLIGFLRTTGAFKNGADRSVSGTTGTPIDYSNGVASLGNAALLAGVGIDLEEDAPTINRIVKLDLGAQFALTDSGASVSLGAVASSDIPAFAYVPGTGLLVADRSGSRLVMVEALFPGSLRIVQVTPSRGRWRGVTQAVQIAGTGFGANAADLHVTFDGVETPIKSLVNGTITVDAPDFAEAREATIEVSSATTSDSLFPGFTYGFQRGDANDDGTLAISDAIMILNYLFSGGDPPPCFDAADLEDSETLSLTDSVYLLNYLFLGTSPEPVAPFSAPGIDPSGDFLRCAEDFEPFPQ